MSRIKDLKKEFKHSKKTATNCAVCFSLGTAMAIIAFTQADKTQPWYLVAAFISTVFACLFIDECSKFQRHDAFEVFAIEKVTKERVRLEKMQKLKELQAGVKNIERIKAWR